MSFSRVSTSRKEIRCISQGLSNMLLVTTKPKYDFSVMMIDDCRNKKIKITNQILLCVNYFYFIFILKN